MLTVVHRQGTAFTWGLWHVPASNPTFMDARVITAGAVAVREGKDPMIDNPADIEQRPLNYPRIWQGLYRLGLDEYDGDLLGAIFVAALVAGLVLFCARLPNPPVLLLLAGIFSPAVVLGVDRGNTDLAVFGLLCLALICLRRWPGVAFGTMFLAFVLKLFPLAALAAFVNRGRPAAVRWLGLAAALAGLYLLYSYSDLLQVRAGTPRGTWLAYGMDVLWMEYHFHDVPWADPLHRVSQCATLGSLLLAAWTWWRRRVPLPAAPGLAIDAFRVGMACYTGTFVLGNNFDYRMVFLILTLPQLAQWSGLADRGPRDVARLCTIAILFALWSPFWEVPLMTSHLGRALTFTGGELATWVVFASGLNLLAASWPEWLRRPVPAAIAIAGAAERIEVH